MEKINRNELLELNGGGFLGFFTNIVISLISLSRYVLIGGKK